MFVFIIRQNPLRYLHRGKNKYLSDEIMLAELLSKHQILNPPMFRYFNVFLVAFIL